MNGGYIKQHIMKIMQPPSAVSFFIILESLWILIYCTHIYTVLFVVVVVVIVLNGAAQQHLYWKQMNIINSESAGLLLQILISYLHSKNSITLWDNINSVLTTKSRANFNFTCCQGVSSDDSIYSKSTVFIYYNWKKMVLAGLNPNVTDLSVMSWIAFLFIILSRMCLSVGYKLSAVTWQLTSFYLLFIYWHCC